MVWPFVEWSAAEDLVQGAAGTARRSLEGGKQYRPPPPNGQAGRPERGPPVCPCPIARGYRLPVFTGLVQAIGRVAAIERKGRGPMGSVRLRVDPGSWRHRGAPGDSICINGVCLTVAGPVRGRTGRDGGVLEFDVVPETLGRTTLGELRVGDRVNMEHAVTAATLMGGHFVQGHVDGVGQVVSVRAGDDWRVRVRVPRELRPLMIPKGSVCMDGVSLTIAAVHADGFEVALIPTTLEQTTLSRLRAGDGVNIEADMLVKAVASVLRGLGSGAEKRAGAAKRTAARTRARAGRVGGQRGGGR